MVFVDPGPPRFGMSSLQYMLESAYKNEIIVVSSSSFGAVDAPKPLASNKPAASFTPIYEGLVHLNQV